MVLKFKAQFHHLVIQIYGPLIVCKGAAAARTIYVSFFRSKTEMKLRYEFYKSLFTYNYIWAKS